MNVSTSFEIEVSRKELIQNWDSMITPLSKIDSYIANLITATPALLSFSKWGMFLPIKFQVDLMRNRFYDIEKTESFLRSLRLKDNLTTS